MSLFNRSRAASSAALVSLPRATAVFLATSAFVFATLGAAQDGQTFTGVISDDQCAGDHASMRMGPTDAECTRICIVAHAAAYVLVDGTEVYALSDQKTPEAFAGQKVAVTGTLDPKTKTIRVASIRAA